MDKLLWNILWGMIQSKLQSMWINTQWVNFNDMNSLNDFAKQILPWMIKSNPQMKEWIKQNAPQDKKDEVVQIVDNI